MTFWVRPINRNVEHIEINGMPKTAVILGPDMRYCKCRNFVLKTDKFGEALSPFVATQFTSRDNSLGWLHLSYCGQAKVGQQCSITTQLKYLILSISLR